MPSIRLADGGAYACEERDTLLRGALRAGLGLPYECNSGSCGTCKVELLEGTVESLWPAAPGLTDRDRARRRILACQSEPRSDCVLKARLSEDYRPLHAPRRFEATLEATRDLTRDLREFRFRASGAPGFRPGQYALFRLQGVAWLRAYSLSNVDEGSGAWEFQVKRVPGGKATSAMFALRPGDAVALDGPYGMAYLRLDSPRDIVCIGGGSGLSAVLSIARGAARDAGLAHRQLDFFYGARGPLDLCAGELLAKLPGYGERIRFHPVISMPELDDAKSWSGATGFVHDHVAATLGPRMPGLEFYFAGPPPMVQAVQAMLAGAKVPPGQVHFDSFY